jgi:hypothetical protein
MVAFYVSWVVSAMIIVGLAAWAGYGARKKCVGILIDNRGRFSLNHLQIVMWTVLILSAVMGLFVARFHAGEANLLGFSIPEELLVLMGISVGSATVGGAAKSAKDATAARIARVGTGTLKLSNGATKDITAKFSQIFLEEEGDMADQAVDVTKFQNFMFTLLTGIAFVVLACKQTTMQGLPPLSKEMLWLLGISHGGYIGGKLPTKS